MAHTLLQCIKAVDSDTGRFQTWFDTGITGTSTTGELGQNVGYGFDVKWEDELSDTNWGIKFGFNGGSTLNELIAFTDYDSEQYYNRWQIGSTRYSQPDSESHVPFGQTNRQIFRKTSPYVDENGNYTWGYSIDYLWDDEYIWTEQATRTDTFPYPDTNVNLNLFNWGYSGGTHTDCSAEGWFYYFKMYDEDGEMTHNILPVKKDDGTICLYDECTNTYIYRGDSGTGQFQYIEQSSGEGIEVEWAYNLDEEDEPLPLNRASEYKRLETYTALLQDLEINRDLSLLRLELLLEGGVTDEVNRIAELKALEEIIASGSTTEINRDSAYERIYQILMVAMEGGLGSDVTAPNRIAELKSIEELLYTRFFG